ncbi:ribonuclease H-like domain-containing protein [Tanacetum coccineum]
MEGCNGTPAFDLPKCAANNGGKSAYVFPPLPVLPLEASPLLSSTILPFSFGALSDIYWNPMVLPLVLRVTEDTIRKVWHACPWTGGLIVAGLADGTTDCTIDGTLRTSMVIEGLNPANHLWRANKYVIWRSWGRLMICGNRRAWCPTFSSLAGKDRLRGDHEERPSQDRSRVLGLNKWYQSLLRDFDLRSITFQTSQSQTEMDPYVTSTPNSTKLPILDTGKFEQWKFRIQQYLQHEHYALWEVIEFGDSYRALAQDKSVSGEATPSSRSKGRTVAVTAKDMQKRRNDVKARTTLLLALPDEHQLRFSKYETAKELWEAILRTFGGNEATKKTKKNLLKQQYGNFKAEGSETLEQTFNRLQAIVSQLEFLDVPVEQEDLNQKFLTSLSPEWLMHTIVWRNRNDLDTMSLDDLYNHLKVYESEVQKKGGSSSQNMAFISSSNTNSGKSEVPTAQSFSTASGQVTTASTEVATATFSHDTICAYIATQQSGSQIKYEDITQIDDDDIEEMDIKWNMALLSMRADRFWKKTGKKITIQGSDVAGFDKSKVECFNCHKLGHFARECRAPRSQDRSRRESYKKEPKVEEPSHKAMMAIDGIGWDWSFMAEENEASENQALVAEEVVPTEFALMAMSSSSSDNEVYDDSYCSKSCRKNTENLTTKISKLREELFDSESDLCNYKRGLSQVEARLVEFKINESKFCEKIRVLERDLELKDYKIENLTNELEEVKKERDGIDSKLEKFVNSSKDLDQMLESQKSGKDKKGVGFDEYRAVPPPPAQVYSSPMPDLSWTGLPEFADNTVTDYTRPTPSVDVTNDVRSELDGNNLTVCEHGGTSSNAVSKPIINFVKESGCPNVIKINNIENARKPTAKYAELYRNITQSSNVRSNNFGPPIIEDWDSEDESDTESTPIESIRSTINQNRDQPRGNQRNWNNLKSQQLGKDFVMQNKACYKCGSFEHLKVNCNKNKWVNKGKNWSRVNYTQGNLTPKAILLKSGTKTIAPNRSFSTARTSLNVAQPKMKSFVKSAHSNVKRPFERKAVAKNKIWVPTVRTKNPTVGLKVPTAKPTVAAAKGNKGKAVKASARWIWKPKQISGEGSNVNGVSGKPLDNIDDKGFWDSGCSRHMTGNISYLSDYEPYDGGYVSFGYGGGKITGKGTIKTVPSLPLKSPIYHEPSVASVVSASVVDRSIGIDNPHLSLGSQADLWCIEHLRLLSRMFGRTSYFYGAFQSID